MEGCNGVRHTSRSSGLLRVETSRLGFPRLALRLAEASRQVVHVAPSQRLRRSQLEDGWVDVMGYVGPCYPWFTIFILLSHKSIIVI
jgi:hypothetical protein